MAISSVGSVSTGAITSAAEADPVETSQPIDATAAVAPAQIADGFEYSEGRKLTPGLPGTGDDSIGDDKSVSNGPRHDLKVAGTEQVVDVAITTADLSDAAKAQVAALIADPVSGSDAAYALGSPTFAALDKDQKEKMINVMAKSGPECVQMMAVAIEVTDDLSSLRATDGTTVMDNLSRMADAGLGPFIGGLVADMIQPQAIRQGTAPTCTAATMQYEMAKNNPAEYCRLIAGLGIEGKVTMAGGGVLETQPGAAIDGSIANKDLRTPSESVFQAALMEFANGDEKYDVNTLRSTGANGTHAGLNGEQIRGALNNLFGVTYNTNYLHDDVEAGAALRKLPGSSAPNRPTLIDITVPGQTTNHCVAFDSFKDGVVTLRDPTTNRTFTMTEKEFTERAASIHSVPTPDVIQQRRSPAYTTGRGKMFLAAEP